MDPIPFHTLLISTPNSPFSSGMPSSRHVTTWANSWSLSSSVSQESKQEAKSWNENEAVSQRKWRGMNLKFCWKSCTCLKSSIIKANQVFTYHVPSGSRKAIEMSMIFTSREFPSWWVGLIGRHYWWRGRDGIASSPFDDVQWCDGILLQIQTFVRTSTVCETISVRLEHFLVLV